MRVIEAPQALPGQCRFCGHPQRGPYMDTEISEEFYGAWIICSECFAGMAHMMGYMTLEKSEKIQKEFADQSMIITDLQIRLEAALRACENLNIAQSGYTNVMRVEDGNRILESPSSDDSKLDSRRDSRESASETLSEGTGELLPGEGETSESLHDKRVGELRSTSNEPTDFELSF